MRIHHHVSIILFVAIAGAIGLAVVRRSEGGGIGLEGLEPHLFEPGTFVGLDPADLD